MLRERLEAVGIEWAPFLAFQSLQLASTDVSGPPMPSLSGDRMGEDD